jgi:hypothetical protein
LDGLALLRLADGQAVTAEESLPPKGKPAGKLSGVLGEWARVKAAASRRTPYTLLLMGE